MLADQADILICVSRCDKQVSAGVFDLGKLSAEFGVALGVPFLGNDLAAQFCEMGLKEFMHTDRIRRSDIGQEGDFAQAKFVVGEVGQSIALIGIDEAHTEHIGMEFPILGYSNVDI